MVGSLIGGRSDIAEAMDFVSWGIVKPKVISIKPEEPNGYERKLPKLGVAPCR